MSFTQLSSDILRQHKGTSFVGVTTCFFCHDGKGEFFMGQRSQKTRDEQGHWDTGGGGLKFGQSALDNLKREALEEYNAEALETKFLGYRDVFRTLPDGTPTHWLSLDFAVLVDRAQVKINEPDMFDNSGWFTLDNLPAPLHSQQLIFFKKYHDQLSSILTS